RIHRIGQTKKVTYIHLTVKDTVDEVITQSLIEKRELAKFVVDDLKKSLLGGTKMTKKLEEKLNTLKEKIENEEEIEMTGEVIEEVVAEEEVVEEKPAKKAKKRKAPKKEKAPKAENPKKEKKEKAPKKEKTAKETAEDVVTAAEIAETLKIAPADLRKRLRREKIEKPESGRWAWPKGHEDLEIMLAWSFEDEEA